MKVSNSAQPAEKNIVIIYFRLLSFLFTSESMAIFILVIEE